MEKPANVLLTLVMALYCFVILCGMDALQGSMGSAASRFKNPSRLIPDQDIIRHPGKPFFERREIRDWEGSVWYKDDDSYQVFQYGLSYSE